MAFKWEGLKSEDIEISEVKKFNDDPLRGVCHSDTPDCGSIKKDPQCQCGQYKDSHHSLCTACHSILPEDLQKDVDWCPEIYQAAIQYLTQ